MEDIPNKVRDVLRIIVDVNLLTEDGKEYIEICVNSNTYPVNSVRPLPMCSGMMRVVAMMESSSNRAGEKRVSYCSSASARISPQILQ